MRDDVRRGWPRLLVFALAVAAVVLVVLPVQADYVNDVGSDTVEYRTASCGPSVSSLLGVDPGLGGGSERPIGGESARTACTAAAAQRSTLALLMVLVAIAAAWTTRRRRNNLSS